MAEIFDDVTKTVFEEDALTYANDVRYAVHPELPGGVDLKYVKVTGLGSRPHKTGTITTGIVAEMSQAEKDAVDAAELAAAKAARKLDLKTEGWNYVITRYDAGTQRMLVQMYLETYVVSNPARRAHIGTWLTWLRGVAEHVQTKVISVDSATSVAEVNAIVLNTAAMDAADPGITIGSALSA